MIRKLGDRMAKIHSGVAFRLLAGLSIMAALAVCASLIGHFAVDGYKEPFQQTVAVDLPNLVATSRLAQDAVSMTSNAQALVLAKSQAGRRDAMARIQDQIKGMQVLVNRFPESDVTADTVQYVVRQGAALVDNLKVLDQRIDTRINLDLEISQSLARMYSLERAISALSAQVIASSAPIDDWKQAAQHTLLLLALAATITQPSDADKYRADIAAGIDQTSLRLARIPAAAADEQVSSLSRQLGQLCLGENSLLDLKVKYFAVGDLVRILMNRNKVLSDEMVAMVASVAGIIEGNAMRRTGMSRALLQMGGRRTIGRYAAVLS